MVQLSTLEEKAVELVKSRGEKGLYQYELWKLLKIDSREGSRLTLRLVKKGLIVREPVIHSGRKTYKLYYVRPRAPKIMVSINSVLDIPCFRCPNEDKCSEGSFHNPEKCPLLTRWIAEQVAKRRGNGLRGL